MGLEEKLPKTFSGSNRGKTKALKRKIQDDVQMVEPYFLASMTVYNFLLPPIHGLPHQFGKLLTDAVIDSYMRKELEECKAINWCRNIRTLSPIKNKGDGNCLLHAVSLYMWGVHDSMLLLRRLLYIALVHDTGQIKARWRKERGFLDQNIPEGCQLNSGQWESEWQHVVKSAEDQKQGDSHPCRLPYESLEEVHIFMLSNILRRPIIVLGDSVIRSIRGKTIAANNFVGIYLPLLRKPSDCVKSPIVLGFASNHFVPLVAMEEDLASENQPMTTVEAVSLVTNTLTFIGVHFLMQDEEERVNELLQEYLHITEVPVTERNGLTLVLSSKLNITKLPREYNLMIDFVQAAERVFDGKEPIVPSQHETNTDIDLTEELLRNDFNGRPEAQMVDSYHASRERQQRMLDRRPSLNSKTSSNSNEKVNFNTDDKSKGHHTQDKVPFSPRTVQKDTKPSRAEKMCSAQMVKCKTPKCTFYGSEEAQGYCSTCLMEYLKKNIAARNAAAASRMDSYEMSVTSTDCQYPGCAYAASVYTYPYCHEHKALSPYHTPEAHGGTRAAASGKQQQVNDLNKERSSAKSSSLTEQTSSSSSSRGKGTMQREHSRSLEDAQLPGEVGPGYVHEPRPDWCTMPECRLMGHPENQFLCTPHYTEMKLRLKAKGTVQHDINYHQQQKPSTAQKVEEWLRNGEDFRASHPDNSNDSTEMITEPIFPSLTSQGRTCKEKICSKPGNPLFQGCCTDCYLKLDINGDTEPLEQPRYREGNKENQIGKKEGETINQKIHGTKDKEIDLEQEDKMDIVDHQLDSFQGPESSVDEKHEGSRTDTQEFNKCKKDTCNRLAPPSGTEGYCSDCHYRAQESLVAEPPSVPNYSEAGLRADTISHTAAASIASPPVHYIRNVSLQSFPSQPVKQSYPTKSYKHTVDPPTQQEVSTQLRCTTRGCSGIYVKLDHNITGLCYKCLKERKETGHIFSGQSEIQENTAAVQGESPTSDEAKHLLRRLSSGRRSGRKRHTIASPPSIPFELDKANPNMEEKSCMSPLCKKVGNPTYNGFCKDCYNWMCLKFEQIDIQGLEEDRKAPCATKGCEFFGTPATTGYCSQCYRKQQKSQGKEVTFGMGRQNTSGRSITPPPGARGQLCANPHCDHYGQKAYCNFCPSCFKTFDAGSGIRYNPPPTRGSFVPPGNRDLDSYCWSTTAALQSNVPPPLPPRAAQHFIPPIDILSPSDPLYYTSHTSGLTGRPTDVAAQFGETMERVEIASRMGNQKCLTETCLSFGNSKCNGYCNSCYVKRRTRPSFV